MLDFQHSYLIFSRCFHGLYLGSSLASFRGRIVIGFIQFNLVGHFAQLGKGKVVREWEHRDCFIFYTFFYCCSSPVVSIFPSPLSPAPPISASHPRTYPFWLCPCVLYTCSLMALPLFSSIISLLPPLWSLSVCSLFQCLWFYFACLSAEIVNRTQ